MRLLILIALIALAIAFVRRLRARDKPGSARPAIDAKAVRCARCQVYFPSQEAIVRDGDNFCSRAHAEAGRTQK